MEERDTFLGLILAREEQATMRDVKSLDFSFLALHVTSLQYKIPTVMSLNSYGVKICHKTLKRL